MVSKSPCKNNIMYVVVESAAIEEVFIPIAKRLHESIIVSLHFNLLYVIHRLLKYLLVL